MRLRVISGSLGGRSIEWPKNHSTHPMSEKIRGALFNMLGDIEGLSVLDAFTGSGAIAFEAISRGASSVIAIDSDKDAHKIATQNAATLGVNDKVKVVQANASSWSDNNPSELFDIVVLDPPYDKVKQPLLQKLAAHTKNGGITVLSLPPDEEVRLDPKFTQLARKSYGDAVLVFYRKTA